MSAKSRAKKRKYQNDIIKRLSIWLILNSLLYFVCSARFVEVNLGEITEYVLDIRNKINFVYSIELYSFINFGLIVLAAIRTLFKAKKIPVILMVVLLFILRIDDNLVVALGDMAIEIRMFIDDYPINDWVTRYFIDEEYGIENLNYAVVAFMPIYFFLKKAIYDSIVKGFEKIFLGSNKAKKKVSKSSSSKTVPSGNKSSYSAPSTCSNSSSVVGGSYYEDDEEVYYTSKKTSSVWGGVYNNDSEKEPFVIYSEYDKKLAHDMKYTDPNARVIDQYGIERPVWEYANNYENEQREEEERRRREEYDYYNSYNNNSYNYSPYEDNDYYSNNNDDYYSVNNDDYYSNNNDDYCNNYGGEDNDSVWF